MAEDSTRLIDSTGNRTSPLRRYLRCCTNRSSRRATSKSSHKSGLLEVSFSDVVLRVLKILFCEKDSSDKWRLSFFLLIFAKHSFYFFLPRLGVDIPAVCLSVFDTTVKQTDAWLRSPLAMKSNHRSLPSQRNNTQNASTSIHFRQEKEIIEPQPSQAHFCPWRENFAHTVRTVHRWWWNNRRNIACWSFKFSFIDQSTTDLYFSQLCQRFNRLHCRVRLSECDRLS